MATFELRNLEARLAYLAVRYHLARPGSQFDQSASQSLTEIAGSLEPQLHLARVTIDVSEGQWQRLLNALSETINELKAYPLLDLTASEQTGGRHTAAPQFDADLRRLFPEVTEDPDEAPQLAGHVLALRRRLEQASTPVDKSEEPAEPSRRPWWRFWSRGGG